MQFSRAGAAPRNISFAILAGAVICLTLAGTVAAQQESEPAPGIRDPFNQPDAPGGVSKEDRRGAKLTVSVLSGAHNVLEHQAAVKITHRQTSVVFWQTAKGKSAAVFNNLPVGIYDVEVDAVGFVSARREFNVQNALATYSLELELIPDPGSIDLADIPSNSDIPGKARKQVSRALDELRSGNLRGAQKELNAAEKSAPSSADVNYFLGYLALEERDFSQAQTHLTRAIEVNRNQIQALTLLGELLLQQNHYAEATVSLEKAVALNSNYSLPHELLAETYIHQKEFAKAKDQADLALEKSKGAEINAQIVRGEALANLGERAAAIASLKTFLQASPSSPLAPQVNKLLSELQQASSKDTGKPGERAAKESRAIESSAAIEPANEKWQPPGVDDVIPPVTPNVACPQQQVIERAGERIREFVQDVSQFAAIEEILHEQMSPIGRPIAKFRRDFNYFATIEQNGPGMITVDEYRVGRSDLGDFPQEIATRGLPTLALIFHPDLRDDYEMKCEGLGEWNGQATWLVHFRQQDDRPKRVKAYNVGGVVYPVGLKGRAWISAETYQIVRMESELVKPIPAIRLISDHQIVDYGAVSFAKKNTTLWLPKSAELYFDFRKRRYYRRHSFDHFLLFAVDANDKVVNPPISKKADENTNAKSN